MPNSKKFLDAAGLSYFAGKLDDYPTNEILGTVINAIDSELENKADINSPALTGAPTAPTAAAGTNTTQIATTAFVNNAIKNYSDVPSYVIEESESVLSKAFSHNSSNKTIRFIAVSDGHNDATEVSHDYTKIANLHCGQAIKYIADRIPLDFVASLGDMTWAGVSGNTYTLDMVKQDIQEMNSFLAAGFKGIPNIRVIGNHDQCLCSGSRLQNKEAYNLIGRYNSGEKTFDNYGYYDLDFAKVRIIYLNTSEITNANSSNAGAILNVSQDQKNWLAELLIYTNQKTDANEWKILILSHAPLDMVGNIGSDILIPYTNGGTYNSYNFTNHNVEILGNIHGHVHCFSYGYISNKIRRFTVPNSNFYDNNHYKTISGYSQWADTTTYPKTANSRTDTSFSLITIDLENNICYVDNYGAGIDRTFDLSYYKTVSSISNITYSGPTTIGTTIDKTNISYTLTYSDNSTSTLSGGDITISPATIASIGDNTITISYDDGTSSFSNSIIIVGTAIPINNLLNLSNRTYETLTPGTNISTALDETKAYTNVGYGKGNGSTLPAGNCTATNITEHGLTITGCSQGGDDVAFPVQIDPTKHYTFSYDYSGSGKVRVHGKWANSSGTSSMQNLFDSTGDTAGTSGSYTIDLHSPSTQYTWAVIMLSANTNGTKTYSNVVLAEKTT